MIMHSTPTENTIGVILISLKHLLNHMMLID